MLWESGRRDAIKYEIEKCMGKERENLTRKSTLSLHTNIDHQQWFSLVPTKLLYNSKCPSVCPFEALWEKRDFLGSYKR